MEVHFRLIKVPSYMKHILCNGSRTECSPMRSVMVRVITFVDHEFDYRPNKTTPSNHKNYNFREEQPSYERKGNFALNDLNYN